MQAILYQAFKHFYEYSNTKLKYIQRHTIFHFKVFGMMNLHYEIRIFKKSIIDIQWQFLSNVWFDLTFIGCYYFDNDKNCTSQNGIPTKLWIWSIYLGVHLQSKKSSEYEGFHISSWIETRGNSTNFLWLTTVLVGLYLISSLILEYPMYFFFLRLRPKPLLL